MATRPRTGTCSFADFFELVAEDQKADLPDGVIYMASPESLDHNELLGWLCRIVGVFVEERGLGRVTVDCVAYRLAAQVAPEPDVAFASRHRADIVKHGYVDGPPDLAVEIVSPDSVERDYDLKRRQYESAGVQEYWILDPAETKATFLVRPAPRAHADQPEPRSHRPFVEAPTDGFIFRSRVLTGFFLDTRWLWQRPLPPVMRTVQSILTTSRLARRG